MATDLSARVKTCSGLFKTQSHHLQSELKEFCDWRDSIGLSRYETLDIRLQQSPHLSSLISDLLGRLEKVLNEFLSAANNGAKKEEHQASHSDEDVFYDIVVAKSKSNRIHSSIKSILSSLKRLNTAIKEPAHTQISKQGENAIGSKKVRTVPERSTREKCGQRPRDRRTTKKKDAWKVPRHEEPLAAR